MTALSRAIAASPDGFSAAAGPYRAPATPPSDATIAPDPVTYLRCPLCGEPMNRTRALSDLKMVVDRCLADGVWFDEGELGRAVAHVTKQRGSDEWARAIAAMLDGVLSARET